MASIGCDSNGFRRVLFVAGDGRRKTIRLGKATAKQAQEFKAKVEHLAGAVLTGSSPSDETSRWLAERDDTIHSRLVAAGLAQARDRTSMSLGAFIEDYFASMLVKESTAVTYRQTKRVLLEHFGGTASLRSITPVAADKWRQWLKGAGLADSTIARRVKCARQIFRRAVKWKMLADNPFADVRAGSQSNKSRMFFISREVATKVLDACPDVQWKMLFALSRYGGLRCPSEHLALKWSDVDWAHDRIRVPSSKTEHIEGGDCRFIPLFPELRPYLMEILRRQNPAPNSSSQNIGAATLTCGRN